MWNGISGPILGVLFDLDGTLVETHIDFPAMTLAMDEMARAVGAPEQIYAGRDILGVVYATAEWLDRQGDDGAAFARDAFAALEELEVQGCSRPESIAGASSTLAELRRRGIGIGIVTRNCRRVSTGLVDRFNLIHDVLLTRDDVPRVKPDPDHLHRALDVIGARPEQSMMVGDHWMDVRAGVEAGCRITVGVLHGRSREFYERYPPTYLAESITNVVDYLSG